MPKTARPGDDSGRAVPFPGRLSVLGLPVDAVDAARALEVCEGFLAGDRPRQVVTANPLMLLAAERDAGLREAVRAADLVVPDGAGLALAAALRGRRLPRVPGIELMESLCGRPGRRVFLFGAAPGVAEAAGRALTARHPGLEVSGATHGYSLTSPAEEDRVIGAIRSSRSDVLFAALSTPFQDAWIHRNLARFGVKLAMGVGGSFDVLSGRLRRAPAWMRSGGLEWLFRLRQEPRRIGRMAKLPLFLGKILLEK